MTENEAYPGRPYETRCLTAYAPGDVVTVGPAYRMGGSYVHDGCEGTYYVLSRIGDSPDYKLARNPGDSWDVIVYASRLTLGAAR